MKLATHSHVVVNKILIPNASHPCAIICHGTGKTALLLKITYCTTVLHCTTYCIVVRHNLQYNSIILRHHMLYSSNVVRNRNGIFVRYH